MSTSNNRFFGMAFSKKNGPSCQTIIIIYVKYTNTHKDNDSNPKICHFKCLNSASIDKALLNTQRLNESSMNTSSRYQIISSKISFLEYTTKRHEYHWV